MSDDPVSAEEVAHRRFSYAFRGFDPGEVRDYLDRVAAELRASVKRERELQRRLNDAEHRAAHPAIDEDILTQSLGEETTRILSSAHEVARELRSRAEENAARILRDAHAEAQRIRASAEVVLAERTEEADLAADQIRRAATSEAESTAAQTRQEAAAVVAGAEQEAERMLKEAEVASARVMKELSRRRRIAHAQVEQLLAGRERLLQAYRVVHRTLEEVGEELQRAEPEARVASEAVARRTGVDLDEAQARGEVDQPEPKDGEDAEDMRVDVSPPGSASVAADTAQSLARARPSEPAPGSPDGADAGAASEARPGPGPGAGPQPTPATPPGIADDAGAVIADDAAPAAPPTGTGAADEPADVQRAGTAAASSPHAEEEAERRPTADEPSAVAELFARIKAGRSDAVAHAEEVLAAGQVADQAPAAAPASPAADTGSGPHRAAQPAPAEASSEAEAGRADEAEADEDRAAVKRRDAALEAVLSRLSRKLKRALQDEQNEVLDRLRSHPGRPSEELLPSVADQATRYRRAVTDLLEQAGVAGARFTSAESSLVPEVEDLAETLAEELAAPLRRRLQRGLAGENGEEPTATAELMSAAYREWKTQVVDRLAADAAIGAFSRGTTQVAKGSPLRWIVNDEGGPCPDCDDNALAGPTPGGDAYPTGQEHPPAHTGCRCLLAPDTP